MSMKGKWFSPEMEDEMDRDFGGCHPDHDWVLIPNNAKKCRNCGREEAVGQIPRVNGWMGAGIVLKDPPTRQPVDERGGYWTMSEHICSECNERMTAKEDVLWCLNCNISRYESNR